MSSKEDERKAVLEIRTVLDRLGDAENSYVCKALEGCLEIAEDNIENDFFESYKQSLRQEREKAEDLNGKLAVSNREYEKLWSDYSTIVKQLEHELEWKPYEEKNVYLQEAYDKLRSSCDNKPLSDEHAKEIVCEHGFDCDRVRILKSVPVYEINRHGVLRQSGNIERKPFYYAGDWNCIVFECGGYVHELQDGTVRFHNRDAE